MSALVLVAIALITYVSRAAAVVLLPRPGPRFETVLSRIPVVMATVLDEERLGIALGASDYLTKPIDRGRLIEALERFGGPALGQVEQLIARERHIRVSEKRLQQPVLARTERHDPCGAQSGEN